MTSGEMALWRSVILRAIEDGCGYFAGGIDSARRDYERRMARAWFDQRDFILVCDLAALDPAAVRGHALRAFADSDAGRVPPSMEHQENYADAQRRRRRGFKVEAS